MKVLSKRSGIERKLAVWGFSFTLPTLVFFVIFSFYPILNAFYTSMFDKRLLSLAKPAFVGMKNYIMLFTNESLGFINSLQVTAIFMFGTFIPLVVFSLLFAVLLSNLKSSSLRKFLQMAYYTPAVISSVVATAIWMLIFDPRGLANQWVNTLMHTPGIDHHWMADRTMLQLCTIVVYFWKYIGYYIVLFITGLATIPPTLYEAARIDGASRSQCFFRITLPLLRPTISLVSVMAMLQCLKTFSTQYMFYQGGAPLEPINVITLNIYQTGITNQRIGRACAMSVVLFLIMLVLTAVQLKLSKSEEVDY